MIRNTLAAMTACMLAAIGCGCGSNSGSVTPPDDNTRISLSQSASTDTSVTVDIALENADAAYCTIAAAGSATPSLAEMRKGTSLTASGSVSSTTSHPAHPIRYSALLGATAYTPISRI